MFVLPMFLLLLLLLLSFLRLNPISLLHLAESKRVGHQGLIRSLFLLLDGEQGVVTNFGRGISSGIRILCGDEILVGSSNLAVRNEYGNNEST